MKKCIEVPDKNRLFYYLADFFVVASKWSKLFSDAFTMSGS